MDLSPEYSVDESGSAVVLYTYTDCGVIAESQGGSFDNEIRFTGGVYGESTGLYYLNARFYDPASGRFLNPDSYRGEAADPQSLHLYAYCANNPVNMVDPTGHVIETVIDVVFFGVSLDEYRKAPSVETFFYATWDSVATIMSFVPGSYAERGVKYLSKADIVDDLTRGKEKKMLKENLVKKDGEFVGEIALKSWQDRFMMDLPMELVIGGEEEIEDVAESHVAAYQFICENAPKILDVILDCIYENYETWQEEYGYNEATYEEKEYSMPDIDDIERLPVLITPKRIIILNVEKDGMSYYGVQFVCSWDMEHNLGVMLYKDRIVDIGTDEVAFLSWIAEEDMAL